MIEVRTLGPVEVLVDEGELSDRVVITGHEEDIDDTGDLAEIFRRCDAAGLQALLPRAAQPVGPARRVPAMRLPIDR